jgi:uncharacterized protein YndB with AHSA1/START domain
LLSSGYQSRVQNRSFRYFVAMSESQPTGFTITRTFAAPAQAVYDAWTTPAEFAAWFGGAASDVPVETVSMDVRVGGAWKATMFAGPDRYEIGWFGEFTELDPPTHLVLTLSDGPAEGEPVTVDLSETDGVTTMVMTQSGGHLTPEQYEDAKTGWQTFFDVMKDLVER